jgi:uncharacterized membrane protein SirB2
MNYLLGIWDLLVWFCTDAWLGTKLVGAVVAQVITALFVLSDVRKRKASERPLFIPSGSAWFLIVLVLPYFLGALGYWIVHYSRVSRFET